MVLNYIWTGFFLIGFVAALGQWLFLGDTEVFKRVVDGTFDSAKVAVMDIALPLLRQAVAKAQGAYGQAILQDLDKALQRLQTRHDWLERCMQATAIHLPKAVIWQRLRALRRILV